MFNNNKSNKKLNCLKPVLLKRIIYSSDIETFIFNKKHYISAIGLKTKNYYKCFFIKNAFSPNNLINLSIQLFKNFYEYIVKFLFFGFMYFHNLSAFDGILISEYFSIYTPDCFKVSFIIKENKIFEINFLRSLILRDSYLLLPSSIHNLSDIFLSDKKIAYNYKNNFFGNLISNKKNYLFCLLCLKKDTYLLYKIIFYFQQKIIFEFCVDITNAVTIASLSFKIFRTKYLDKTIFIENCFDSDKDRYIRKSYFGGISEVYTPKGSDLYYYDVNSLYPYSMLKPMPGGVGIWCKPSEINIENFFGFIEVTIYCEKNVYGFLPVYDSSVGLIQPYGIISGIYFSEEIKYCLSNGCKLISIKSGLKYKKSFMFNNFVYDFYFKKVESKKKSDYINFYINKLILNSCYGRFGMRNENFESFITDNFIYYNYIDDAEALWEFQDKALLKINRQKLYYFNFHKEIKNKLKFDKNNSIFENHKNKNYFKLNISSVQISSAISSYSRIFMGNLKQTLLKKKINVLYSDTDSVVTDKYINDDKLVSQNELGKLKKENERFIGIFLAPKLYCMKKGDIFESRIKGLLSDNKKKINFKWFDSQLNSKNFTETNYFFNKNIVKIFNKMCIISDTNINYTYTFNFIKQKREKVYKDGVWVGTRQLKFSLL